MMEKESEEIVSRLKRAKAAALKLRATSGKKRNQVLEATARLIEENQKQILEANEEDLKGLPDDTSPAFKDRLLLNDARLKLACESLRQVASFSDPLEEVVESKTLPNGLKARRVRAPLGVILMIFESRPNVAMESFSLALKSGNVLLLRGGKESMRTTAAIYQLMGSALKEEGLSEDFFWGITDPNRELVKFLLAQTSLIDVVVPRGGDSLIKFVVENTRIPIIKNDRGLCHVYVHDDADLKMATAIIINAKTQRPGVCNAMETLLVHTSVAAKLLPVLYQELQKKNVEWFGCPETLKILHGQAGVFHATKESFDTEYLDLKMSCRVVSSLEEAIAHIETHGSRHSESILTQSESAARKFQQEIDAAAVYWNASTRFTDGFELGLGGELGISTQKLHVRGPVGLKELTCPRWILDGTGQIRN